MALTVSAAALVIGSVLSLAPSLVHSIGLTRFTELLVKLMPLPALAGFFYLSYAIVWHYFSFRWPLGQATPQTPSELLAQPVLPFEIYSLLAVIGIALLLRIHNMDRGLYYDELITAINFVDVHSLWKTVSSDHLFNNHIANSILAHFSLLLFGRYDWALRLPALLLGLATLCYFWYFIRRFLGPEIALTGALILAVSPLHMFYSVSARGYSGVILFTLISTHLYFRLLHCPTRRDASIFTVTSVISIYFHLYSALIIVVQMFFVLYLSVSQTVRNSYSWHLSAKSFRICSICFAIVIGSSMILYAPIFPRWVMYLSRIDQEHFQLFFPVKVFDMLSGNTSKPIFAVIFCMSVIGFLSLKVSHALEVKYFALLFLLPILVSWLSRHKYLDPRFLIFLLPNYILCMALGFSSFWHLANKYRSKVISNILYLAAISLAIVVLISWSVKSSAKLPGGGYRDAAIAIESDETQQLGVCVIGSWARAIQYYLKSELAIPRNMEEFEKFVRSYPEIKCVDAATQFQTRDELTSLGEIREFLSRNAEFQKFKYDIIVYRYRH
jgi:hypothetical protein